MVIRIPCYEHTNRAPGKAQHKAMCTHTHTYFNKLEKLIKSPLLKVEDGISDTADHNTQHTPTPLYKMEQSNAEIYIKREDHHKDTYASPFHPETDTEPNRHTKPTQTDSN